MSSFHEFQLCEIKSAIEDVDDVTNDEVKTLKIEIGS